MGEANLRLWPGEPYPLGATWDGKGVNFALFSTNAEEVQVCFFDTFGTRETASRGLTIRSAGIASITTSC